MGKVRVARNEGKPLAEGIAIDPAGRPTRDPQVMYSEPRGALLPFGGHKGAALSLMVEVLASGLTGGAFSHETDFGAHPGNQTPKTGQFLFVVDPAIWATAGPARRAWLAANVLALAERIPLTVLHGDPREVVPRVADGRRVHVAAETTPYGRRRDAAVGTRVELVATGATNRTVAESLFLSPKTVEYHLHKAFVKLGVHSRAELIHLLAG